VPDIVLGLNVLRILLGDPPDREYVSRVLNTIIYPLVTTQPKRRTLSRTQTSSEPRATEDERGS
jgi:hypothetical protein